VDAWASKLVQVRGLRAVGRRRLFLETTFPFVARGAPSAFRRSRGPIRPGAGEDLMAESSDATLDRRARGDECDAPRRECGR